MRGILDCATLNDFEEVYGLIIKENHDMLDLMRHLGLALETDPDDNKMYIATHHCI